MFLNRIHIDPRCREARRDLADPYQLHATLCRAFNPPDRKCPSGQFLWRIEPETDRSGFAQVLVQSRSRPDWKGIGVRGWLAGADPPIDLRIRLKLDLLTAGRKFRFRLRANPCVCRKGKRIGLLRFDEQMSWLVRKAGLHGFGFPGWDPESADLQGSSLTRIDVRISQDQMLRGRQHGGNAIRLFAVLYEGLLSVTDAGKFNDALEFGIGHGKAMGLGLMSVVPIT